MSNVVECDECRGMNLVACEGTDHDTDHDTDQVPTKYRTSTGQVPGKSKHLTDHDAG